MKKINLVGFITVVSSMICLMALTLEDLPRRPYSTYYPYPGQRDWVRDRYMDIVPATSLGVLANYGDVIAKGTVMSQNWPDMVIRVDHALLGCTNKQTVVIRKIGEQRWEEIYTDRFPTNSSEIVFIGLIKEIPSVFLTDLVKATSTPLDASVYSLHYDRRSWWYADRDEGVLYT